MKYGLLFMLLLMTCGCSRIKNKSSEIKGKVVSAKERVWDSIRDDVNDIFRTGFYTDPGYWDYYRFPLVAPYELSAIDSDNEWHCIRRDNIDEFGGAGLTSCRLSVEAVGVTDSIIYMRYSDDFIPLDRMPGNTYDRWHKEQFAVIDVINDSVMWFDAEQQMKEALLAKGVFHPQFYQVDSLYKDFSSNRRLPFMPDM